MAGNETGGGSEVTGAEAERPLGATSPGEAPVVPTRRNVCTPSWASSSMAIEADGPPIPVEVTSTGVLPM